MKESAILVVVLGTLGWGLSYLDSLATDYEEKSKALETEVGTLETQTKALQDKFFKAQRQTAMYQELLRKNGPDGLAIGRDIILEKFNEFKNLYYLNDLHLSMEPAKPVDGAAYKRGPNAIVASPVKAEFNTLSDEYVYALLYALAQDLPGSITITDITLERQKDMTDDVMREVAQKGSASMVKSTVNFNWFGIRAIDTTNDAAKKSH